MSSHRGGKKESKPPRPLKLITHDNFAETQALFHLEKSQPQKHMAPRILILNRAPSRLLASISLGVVALAFFPLSGSVASGAEPWWQQPADQVKTVPGWLANDAFGKPLKLELEVKDGVTTFVAKTRPAKLTMPTKIAANTEVTINFSIKPPAKGQMTFYANIVDEGATGLPVAVTATSGNDLLSISAVGVSAGYRTRGNYTRSLRWPEEMRKIVESEMASLPALEDRRFSLRYVLRTHRAEIYFNDMLVSAREVTPVQPAAAQPAKPGVRVPPPISIGGWLVLTVPAGVELFSVETRALAGDSPIFEPVRIDSRLNAARINGTSIASASLPNASAPAAVQGVPFVFPRRDPRGNDHIDVGASWMQLANYEGDTDPNRGPVGGRWAGPLIENPTRIQFRVPKGRYRALHLIAACDSDRDSTPVVTVQFYRPLSGAPENFSTRVPLLTSRGTAVPAVGTAGILPAGADRAGGTPVPLSLPVQLENGSAANLWLVTVPIEPGVLAAFDDLDWCEMEITKEVQLYRAYPDPTQYSAHAGGLPSAAHIYAMTFERPPVSIDLQPDALGHLWIAPVKPSYTVKLRNISGKPHPVKLEMTTISHDGTSKTSQQIDVTVPVAGATAKFTPKVERYGYHDVLLTMKDGDTDWTERRSLAWLQKDTRARGDWEPGRGASYGFWNWAGGHNTPPQAVQIELMSRLGAEWVNGQFNKTDEEGRAAAEKFGVRSLVQGGHSHFYTAEVRKMLDDPAKAKEYLLGMFQKTDVKPSAIEAPDNLSFLAEPQLGQVTTGIPPDYFGMDYTLTPSEEERYRSAERAFVFGARLAKEFWPGIKCQFPYGDPLYPVYFLRRSKEVRELMDGINVDIPVFDRMAENQIHQVSIHRCYIMQEELKKAGIKNPNLVMVEGPCLPTRPGSLTMDEQADNWVRMSLLLYGYGIDRQIGGWGIECANYWGEQHYGGGVYNRLPHVTPKPSACALATMTRHTNRKNLTKWLRTGSLSAYALQFKQYKTGDITHVFWTVRGKRPLTLTVPKGAVVTLYDSMDNATVLPETDGQVTFPITTSPCYIEGLAGDPEIALGEPDNSDSKPGAIAVRLGNPGDGQWQLSKEEDATYANNNPLQIARFPAAMTARKSDAPAEQGGHALAVHLEKPEKDQKLMPFYSTLTPPKPIQIAGKASHIGIWVKGASDWGRVVYSLRDAQGERWLSVGSFSDWNCDDPRSLSFFNFDGWRYLRFEMPAHSPYDRYRENGTTWWGHFGKGNGEVDLPLTLEKIIVERRTHAMYVNDPQPTRAEDVLLGDLNAEYARPENRTEEVVRLDHVRMPLPAGIPDLGNPIADMSAAGVGAPIQIERITLPAQDADGTRCFVHFKPVEGATAYEVWASPYADGRGALQLGKGWKEPGQQIVGLRAETDFYLFAAYTDKDGQPSKPSAGFKIRLQDIFGMK